VVEVVWFEKLFQTVAHNLRVITTFNNKTTKMLGQFRKSTWSWDFY